MQAILRLLGTLAYHHFPLKQGQLRVKLIPADHFSVTNAALFQNLTME